MCKALSLVSIRESIYLSRQVQAARVGKIEERNGRGGGEVVGEKAAIVAADGGNGGRRRRDSGLGR